MRTGGSRGRWGSRQKAILGLGEDQERPMFRKAIPFLFLLLSSCVTVNIYFPAAAVERAADEIIREIQNPKDSSGESSGLFLRFGDRLFARKDTTRSQRLRTFGLLRFGDRLLALLISPAYAQADIDLSTPEIEAIKSRMKQRFPKLRRYLDAGWVGYTKDGLVAVVDPAKIPLRERGAIRQLLKQENRDRLALYRAIAAANGNPEWADEVQAIFARRWIANAKPGWLIQLPDGRWTRK